MSVVSNSHTSQLRRNFTIRLSPQNLRDADGVRAGSLTLLRRSQFFGF